MKHDVKERGERDEWCEGRREGGRDGGKTGRVKIERTGHQEAITEFSKHRQ